jgi:hypothetical protein
MNGETSDAIVATITGASWMAHDTGTRLRPTHDEIAEHAYRRYEVNGRKDGNDLDDWLFAEREPIHHYA